MARTNFIFVKAILIVLLFPATMLAQQRNQQSINSGWNFILNDAPQTSSVKGKNINWLKVNLPHTWNALDIVDDTLGYHQGIGWYKKVLFIPQQLSHKHLELYFEGACNKTTVFINGLYAGEHNGGFTGFKINLDGKISFGAENEILVRVDNGKYLKDSIPPFSADFNLMGGIYRDAWLISTNKMHFNNYFGNEGIMFEIKDINNSKASYKVNVFFKDVDTIIRGFVEYELYFKGKILQSGKKSLKPFGGISVALENELAYPKLWSPEVPNLYDLVVKLKNDEGELLDEISQHVGFKWVGIGSKKEFMLNGKPYKLKGASRHQDYMNMGNALTDAMHERDIELMKDMGCNFIRIAHYPQDPAIYDACDRLGLIAWSEIPVVDFVPANEAFSINSRLMMQEMIFQNYNHPSIAIWGYHNEVRNLDEVSIANARMMDSIAKGLDKQRLTAIAYEANIDGTYFKNPLLKTMLGFADINGYNVYQGWYRGRYPGISNFLDTLYAYNPAKPIMLSEYGAGSVTNIHSYQPSIFDFSEEYQCSFHEAYIKAGNTKPWMIGFAIWNFIDFQRDGREDVSPNINNKGMVTSSRRPKDVFYFYKSQWSKQPFVYITGKNWQERIAVTGKNKSIRFPFVVYSNQQKLLLQNNGNALGVKSSANGKFEWMVNATEGMNNFVCKTMDGKHTDVLNIHYSFIDTTAFSQNTDWQQLNFNSGQTHSFFADIKSNEKWIPDKPYTKGTWGYVDGEVWSTWPSPAWNGIREGIHKPIALTENEPLFQTFIQGQTAWKADVPAGKYRVTILLFEPFTLQQRDNAARIFDIYLNDVLWIPNLDIEKYYGVQSAVTFDKIIDIKNNEGININFRAVSGKTILNGASIRKL